MAKKLTHRQMLLECRKAVKLALSHYDLGDYSIKFIRHGENATYRIKSTQGEFVARLHLAEGRDVAAIEQELDLLNLLSQNGFMVQQALKTKNGSAICQVELANKIFTISLLTWQKGIMRFDSITTHHYFQLGAYMAEMHNFAQKHQNEIKSDKRVDWAADSLVGDPSLFGSYELLKNYYTINYERFHRVRNYLHQNILLHERQNPQLWGIVHSDFHFGNILWQKEQIHPIDFDDFGFGCFLYDIAIPIYNLEDHEYEKFSSAIFDGYRSKRNLTGADIEMVEKFIVARHITMVSWLLTKVDHPRIGKHFINQLPKIDKRIEVFEQDFMHA